MMASALVILKQPEFHFVTEDSSLRWMARPLHALLSSTPPWQPDSGPTKIPSVDDSNSPIKERETRGPQLSAWSGICVGMISPKRQSQRFFCLSLSTPHAVWTSL